MSNNLIDLSANLPAFSIPDWCGNGLLPTINKGEIRRFDNSSPFLVSLSEFIRRFSTNATRIVLIREFLEARRVIKKMGITNGYQWVNGSFTTNIEVLDTRYPNDIDVVTWYHAPNVQQSSVIEALTKADVVNKIDAYFIDLDKYTSETISILTVYWYSMWGHTRNSEIHKGFIRISLADNEDEAEALLEDLGVERDE